MKRHTVASIHTCKPGDGTLTYRVGYRLPGERKPRFSPALAPGQGPAELKLSIARIGPEDALTYFEARQSQREILTVRTAFERHMRRTASHVTEGIIADPS